MAYYNKRDGPPSSNTRSSAQSNQLSRVSFSSYNTTYSQGYSSSGSSSCSTSPRKSSRTSGSLNFDNFTEYGNACKYVGLRNGGATCYMNSVIQQLYHTPGIAQDIYQASSGWNRTFYHLRQILVDMNEKRMPQMYSFWRAFKLWGEPINAWEQQDACEFFVDLISQLDDHLKETNQMEIFKPRFQGVFSDVKVCYDCLHRYESEEAFLTLSLTVKPEKSLTTALDQFVQGVTLKGENAYLCKKCGVKRDAEKTMCIKKLPPVLVVHLKRIKMDWQTGRAYKFNDFFQFPRVLDMEPYTLKGVQNRAKNRDKQADSKGVKRCATDASNEGLYQLVGVVVHTGQASSGHYYSYIKDRHDTDTKGNWFKCNDTTVREYKMTDDRLKSECFGGSYDESHWWNSLPRFSPAQRSNSGYMLFYEKVDRRDTDTVLHELAANSQSYASLQKLHTSPNTGLNSVRSTRTTHLQETVLPGYAHRVSRSRDQSPAFHSDIKKAICCENRLIQTRKHIGFLHPFTFFQSLTDHNIIPPTDLILQSTQNMAEASIEQALKLLPENFRGRSSINKKEIDEWLLYIQNLLKYNKDASVWAMQLLSDDQNYSHILYYLIEFYDPKVRQLYLELVLSILQSSMAYAFFSSQHLKNGVKLMLSLLDEKVSRHASTSAQYFTLLKEFLFDKKRTRTELEGILQMGSFQYLMNFLIGPADEESSNRKWSPHTAKEFAPHIHSMLATMIVYCNVSELRQKDHQFTPYPRNMKKEMRPITMPDDMKRVLGGLQCYQYIQECILAVCEYPEIKDDIISMLCHCCFCNHDFSVSTITAIQSNIKMVSECQLLFEVLYEVLLLKDSQQNDRLRIAIKGQNNIFDICMQSSNKQLMNECIKFIKNLADKCPVLKPVSKEWQKAVKSLKSMDFTDEEMSVAFSLLTIPDDKTKLHMSRDKHETSVIGSHQHDKSMTGSHQRHDMSVAGSHQSHDKSMTGSHQSHDQSMTGSHQSHDQSTTGSHQSHDQSMTGKHQSHDQSMIGNQISHDMSVTGSHQSHDQSVTGCQQSHDQSVIGSQISHDMSVTGSHQSHDQSVIGSHKSHDTSMTGSNESHDQSTTGSHQSHDQSMTGKHQSHDQSMIGNQISHDMSVTGSHQSHDQSVTGCQQSHDQSVIGSQISHDMSVTGSHQSHDQSVIGSHKSHDTSMTGSNESRHEQSMITSHQSPNMLMTGCHHSHDQSVTGSPHSQDTSTSSSNQSYNSNSTFYSGWSK